MQDFFISQAALKFTRALPARVRAGLPLRTEVCIWNVDDGSAPGPWQITLAEAEPAPFDQADASELLEEYGGGELASLIWEVCPTHDKRIAIRVDKQAYHTMEESRRNELLGNLPAMLEKLLNPSR
jgi:hypothetical protein